MILPEKLNSKIFDLAFFSIGNLLNKAFFFALTILAAKTLSSSIFGVFSIIKQLISTAVFISLLSYNYLILRDLNIFFRSNNINFEIYLKEKLADIFTSQVITCLFLILAIIILNDTHIISLKLTAIIILSVFTNGMVIIQNSILSSINNFKVVGIINTIVSIVFLAFLFFFYKNLVLSSYFLLFLSYNLTLFVFQDFYLKKNSISKNILKIKIQFKIKSIFKSLGYLYYHELLSFLTLLLFFILIASFISLSELGEFNLYYQFVMICILIPESLGSYFITSFSNSNPIMNLFKNIKITFLLNVFSFVGFLIMTPFLNNFLGNNYDLGLNNYYLLFLFLIPSLFSSQVKKLLINQKKDKELFKGQFYKSSFLLSGTLMVGFFNLKSVGLIVCIILAEIILCSHYFYILRKSQFKL